MDRKNTGDQFSLDERLLGQLFEKDHGAAYHVRLYNDGMEYAASLADTYAKKDAELTPVAYQLRKYPDSTGLTVAQRMLTETVLGNMGNERLKTNALEISLVLENLSYVPFAEKTHSPNRNKWT